MTRFLVQALLLLAVFAFAGTKGGKPERYVSAIYVFVFVAVTARGLLAGQWSEAGYGSLQTFRFVLDLAAFLAVTAVALRYDRWWPLWVGSAQLLALMAHVLRAAEMPLDPLVYSVMERWPVWLAITLTGCGTWRHWRAGKRPASAT